MCAEAQPHTYLQTGTEDMHAIFCIDTSDASGASDAGDASATCMHAGSGAGCFKRTEMLPLMRYPLAGRGGVPRCVKADMHRSVLTRAAETGG